MWWFMVKEQARLRSMEMILHTSMNWFIGNKFIAKLFYDDSVVNTQSRTCLDFID